MSRVPGKMSCAAEYLDDADVLLDILAEGMHLLWETDISDCPCDSRLDRHLKAAERHVASGQVDVNAVEPDTFADSRHRSIFSRGCTTTVRRKRPSSPTVTTVCRTFSRKTDVSQASSTSVTAGSPTGIRTFRSVTAV